jgi:hypothetical protein
MWFLTSPQLVYTSVGIVTLISKDVVSRAIGLTVDGLTHTLTYMASPSAHATVKTFKDDLEELDIELKLKLVEHWLKDIDVDKITPGSSMEIVYKGIAESCHNLSEIVNQINKKIEYHHTKYFNSWRTLYLDDEMKKLQKQTKILNERLRLVNLVK